MNQHYDEKRLFLRMYVNAKVSITRANGEQLDGRSQDISGAGLLFQCDSALDLDEQITLQVNADKGSFPPLHASASIARVEKNDHGYLIAARIEQIIS